MICQISVRGANYSEIEYETFCNRKRVIYVSYTCGAVFVYGHLCESQWRFLQTRHPNDSAAARAVEAPQADSPADAAASDAFRASGDVVDVYHLIGAPGEEKPVLRNIVEDRLVLADRVFSERERGGKRRRRRRTRCAAVVLLDIAAVMLVSISSRTSESLMT